MCVGVNHFQDLQDCSVFFFFIEVECRNEFGELGKKPVGKRGGDLGVIAASSLIFYFFSLRPVSYTEAIFWFRYLHCM